MKRSREVLIILAGGLGNQLFQLSYALYKTDSNDNIVLDWSLGRPRLNKENRVELSDFELPTNISFTKRRGIVDRIINPSYLARKIVNLHFHRIIVENKYCNKYFEQTINVFSNLVLSIYFRKRIKLFAQTNLEFVGTEDIFANLYIGYFQSYHWLSSKRVQEILHDLILKKSTFGYEEFTNFLSNNINDIPLVAHLRRGDYRNENQIGVIPDSYFNARIQESFEDNPNFSLWIFTDEPRNLNRELINSQRFKTKVVPTSISSAATLELMRHGKFFIISNSTFSWWGAFLAHSDPKPKVVAPNPWYLNLKTPTELFPEHWIKINPWQSEVT